MLEYDTDSRGGLHVNRHGMLLVGLLALWTLTAHGADLQVHSILLASPAGGRNDYTAAGNWLLYDQRGKDGYYDIHRTTPPELTGTSCLTCGVTGLERNVGNPAISNDGAHVLFIAQDEDGACAFAEPGQGHCNDLWIMGIDGSDPKRIYDAPANLAVLHPQWKTGDDTKITWAEMTNRAATGLDAWAIRTADIVLSGTPTLSNVVTHQPCANDLFYETHQWFGNFMLASALCDPAADGYEDLDVVIYDTSTGGVTNLTRTTGVWDEHAHWTPDFRHIVWSSTQGNPSDSSKADYWVMTASGAKKTRLTHFNDPTHPQYLGQRGVFTGDFSWYSGGSISEGLRMFSYTVTGAGEGFLGLLEFVTPYRIRFRSTGA